MPTISQDLYEGTTHELRTLKTGKNEDQVIISSFLKKIFLFKL